MAFNKLVNNIFRDRKRTVKKIKNCESQLPIFEAKVKKLLWTIKYTQSPQTMIKSFDTIKQEFIKIMNYSPLYDIELNGQVINNVDSIDAIRDQYIKDFINSKIDEELKKGEIVTSPFLKESLIKKALNRALTAFTYFPEDAEIVCKIAELEDMLLDCYNKENT